MDLRQPSEKVDLRSGASKPRHRNGVGRLPQLLPHSQRSLTRSHDKRAIRARSPQRARDPYLGKSFAGTSSTMPRAIRPASHRYRTATSRSGLASRT